MFVYDASSPWGSINYGPAIPQINAYINLDRKCSSACNILNVLAHAIFSVAATLASYGYTNLSHS